MVIKYQYIQVRYYFSYSQTLVSTSTSGVTYVSNTNVKIANGLDTSGSPNGTNFSGKMDDIKLYSKAQHW